MKIKATPIKGKDLKPGDLFSTAGPLYWDDVKDTYAIGEKVYIRTETPYDRANDFNSTVYKIEIEAGFQMSSLIPLIESEIESLKQVQEEGDYTDAEVYLSDLKGTLHLILKAIKGEVVKEVV